MASLIPNIGGHSGEYVYTHRGIPLPLIEFGGPRKRPVDQDALARLKESILEQGQLLQPIGVRASKGDDGGPYTLIYGAHRMKAIEELFEEGKWKTNTVPCIVYTSTTPDWFIELAEVDENLMRKELNASERNAWTLLRGGLLKKSGNVSTAKQKNAANGKKGAAVTNKTGAVTPSDTAEKPTVVEALASGLGISKKQVHERVNKAVAAVGGGKVSIEDTDADELIDLGRKAVAAAPETHQKRMASISVAMGKGRDNRAKAREEQPIMIDVLADELADLEKRYGEGMIKEAINQWWKEKHPSGRVPFQTTSK